MPPATCTLRSPQALAGATVRSAYLHLNDDFQQPRALYERAMRDTDRAHLVRNVVDHLHPEYGIRVAEGLGLDQDEVKKLAGLEQAQLVEATVAK